MRNFIMVNAVEIKGVHGGSLLSGLSRVLRVLGAGRSESLIIKPAKELFVDDFHVLMEERGGVTTHLVGQVCDLGTLRHSQVQDVPILSFGLVDTSGRAIKVLVFGEHAESVELQAGFLRASLGERIVLDEAVDMLELL